MRIQGKTSIAHGTDEQKVVNKVYSHDSVDKTATYFNAVCGLETANDKLFIMDEDKINLIFEETFYSKKLIFNRSRYLK